jgi:hypothetical protein
MRPLLYLCACLLLAGCSTEGDITIHNDSGPQLFVTVDGTTFCMDDGEIVTKRIDLGRKFIFGPDDRVVTVRGEGYCKLPFEDFVTIEEDRNVVYSIFGDAGYIDICNLTGYTLELYLSSCADGSWGEPLELVPDGRCTTWMLEEGCWDMLAVTLQGEFEEYNIPISRCGTQRYDLVSASLTKMESSGAKRAPARSGSTELRKLKIGGNPVE